MRWVMVLSGLSVFLVASAVGAQMQQPQHKQELAKSLNGDLSGEYQAVVMYQTYASQAKGPERKQLRDFFEKAAKDEMDHAGMLADEVVSLDAQPTRDVRSVPEAKTDREMLENSLKAENQAIQDYEKRIRQAKAAGQTGLSKKLDEIVRDETEHRAELQKLLKSAG